jgi:hypothetical protein
MACPLLLEGTRGTGDLLGHVRFGLIHWLAAQKTKKADVFGSAGRECPRTEEHIGLLSNAPPGQAELRCN